MSAIEPTVICDDPHMSIRTEDDGTVILTADFDIDREWHFDPDEARRLAGTLLRHVGSGFSTLFEDDDVYWYGPSRNP